MTGRRQPEGKRSECNEVKSACSESDPEPRESYFGWGPILSVRAQAIQEAR
jgi:hypothetical protein